MRVLSAGVQGLRSDVVDNVVRTLSRPEYCLRTGKGMH